MRILILLLAFIYLDAQTNKLGLGIGAISYPDYIGSKSNNFLIAPIPYLRYSNPYFNIDKDGLNTTLFDVKGLYLKLSLGGTLPVNSTNNTLRKGMEDLDVIIEVGPNLIYELYKNNASTVELHFPIRFALSTNLSNVKYQGITSIPHIRYYYTTSNLKLMLSSGLVFSDKKYNAYFYAVDKQYATPIRPQYKASGGFSGIKNKISLTYQKDRTIFSIFISHYTINDAVFNDSPLVEANKAFYIGTSLSYIFDSIKF